MHTKQTNLYLHTETCTLTHSHIKNNVQHFPFQPENIVLQCIDFPHISPASAKHLASTTPTKFRTQKKARPLLYSSQNTTESYSVNTYTQWIKPRPSQSKHTQGQQVMLTNCLHKLNLSKAKTVKGQWFKTPNYLSAKQT